MGERFLLESFGMTVGPEIYHKEKGDGLMSICQKNYDWAYIPRNQNIADNDYIKVRNNYYQILCWCNDSFQPMLDCLRFKSKILKNAHLSPFCIVRPPTFKGNFTWFKKEELNSFRLINLQLVKLDSDYYGQLNIKFQNCCFNRLGFLTHSATVD